MILNLLYAGVFYYFRYKNKISPLENKKPF